MGFSPTLRAALIIAVSSVHSFSGSVSNLWESSLHSRNRIASRTAPVMTVRLDRTGLRSRRISGSVVIDAGIDAVWAVLTDYNGFAKIYPTLVASRRLPPSPDGAIMLEQESAAPRGLPGLATRQFTTMRFLERAADSPVRTLESSLEASRMFSVLQSTSKIAELSPGRTELQYTFEFELLKKQLLLKGPQLMLLTEAKLTRETPGNLDAFKAASEGNLPGYQAPNL